MNHGPLCKAVILLCATAAVAWPQDRQSPFPGPEAQFQTLSPSHQTQGTQSGPPAPQLPAQDANEFVNQAIDHEMAAQAHDHTRWRYHYHREDEKNNSDR